ncbi:hypothetical protein K7A41_07645 [Sphingobacterium sp. InxBP1]|uniref:hypothetical protein n=1 Tax=Sphingobacterium sp. InxBP1 TaxID=2870328 RepID=UPI002243534C|nr:hypothetical protein [Sphingobacterium sp. InxBP1]MCW8311091.1 hypothetical protein [Sphingobacterium sp. InxBP1]
MRLRPVSARQSADRVSGVRVSVLPHVFSGCGAPRIYCCSAPYPPPGQDDRGVRTGPGGAESVQDTDSTRTQHGLSTETGLSHRAESMLLSRII